MLVYFAYARSEGSYSAGQRSGSVGRVLGLGSKRLDMIVILLIVTLSIDTNKKYQSW